MGWPKGMPRKGYVKGSIQAGKAEHEVIEKRPPVVLTTPDVEYIAPPTDEERMRRSRIAQQCVIHSREEIIKTEEATGLRFDGYEVIAGMFIPKFVKEKK